MKESLYEWRISQGFFDGRRSSVSANLPEGYEMTLEFVRTIDGVLVCSGLHLEFPKSLGTPSKTINSSFFQKLGLGELLVQAKKAYVEGTEVVTEIFEEMRVDELLGDWTQLGPAGFPDEKYAAIAWKYEKFLILGLENPVSELAEFIKSDKTTTSGRVLEARKRGLLTTPKKGSFGGKLTDKGKKLLGIEVISAKKSK